MLLEENLVYVETLVDEESNEEWYGISYRGNQYEYHPDMGHLFQIIETENEEYSRVLRGLGDCSSVEEAVKIVNKLTSTPWI